MTQVKSEIVYNKSTEKPIDRQKTCPMLLRVFYSTGCHNDLSEYSNGKFPPNEFQIYTWMDATLDEISSLVKEMNPHIRKNGTYFEFAFVYPDPRSPKYCMREVGVTCCGQKGVDDSKTLKQLRFRIGDYVDIAITPPFVMNPLMRRTHPNPYYRFMPC